MLPMTPQDDYESLADQAGKTLINKHKVQIHKRKAQRNANPHKHRNKGNRSSGIVLILLILPIIGIIFWIWSQSK